MAENLRFTDLKIVGRHTVKTQAFKVNYEIVTSVE